MICLALLATLALEPSLDRAKEETRQILADDKYGFCHDPRYPLTDTEAAWCPPVGPEKNPRCPAFRSACDAPRAVMQDLGRFSFSRGGDGETRDSGGDQDATKDEPDDKGGGDKTGGKSGKRKDPRREVLMEDESLPELGGLGYVMFWVILGAGVLLLIYVIVMNSSRHKADAAAPEEPAPAELGPAPAVEGPSEQLVRDVSALLEQARAAASAGDFTKAIQRVHAALLHRLDHDGLIRVAPFRTNGDYVRDLQPRPELRSSVREIVRDVEQVQFGTASPDASLYDRVLKRVVPIATRRGETLLLLLGLTLLSCDPAKNYPFDRSPSGANAVIELGARYGVDIKYRTTALADLDPDEELGDDDRGRALVLLHDAPIPTSGEWLNLLAWADEGHHLILAGVAPPTELAVRLDHHVARSHELAVTGNAIAGLADLDLITADDTALVTTDDAAIPLVDYSTGETYAVQFERGYRGGDVTVFADDRLFTSGGMMLADNPEFLMRLLKELGAREVELADGLLDLGADTPAEAIANTHLTPFILQMMALLAILYFWRGVRFGRPHDPPSRSRRQFAEHVEALGSQYARARASRHAVRMYATWALDRLREKTLTSRQPGLYPLAQAIAGRTGDDENRVMETLAEASSLQGDAAASKIAGRHLATTTDLRLMQDLARLVRLVGGPR